MADPTRLAKKPAAGRPSHRPEILVQDLNPGTGEVTKETTYLGEDSPGVFSEKQKEVNITYANGKVTTRETTIFDENGAGPTVREVFTYPPNQIICRKTIV